MDNNDKEKYTISSNDSEIITETEHRIEDNVEIDQEKKENLESMNDTMQKLKGLIAKNNEMAKQSTKDTLGNDYALDDSGKKVDIDYQLTQEELAVDDLANEIEAEIDDIKQTKKYAWLAYILFFIPLCINSKSPFVRLHANEGLDVFFIDVFATAMLLCGVLIKYPTDVAIIGYLLIIFAVGLFILTTITKIFQIVQVCRGKHNQTPWLWKTRFIK